mgnify:CR=1 FL=1
MNTMKNKEQTIKKNQIYSGKVLKFNVDEVKLPNKKVGLRETVNHPGGVAILAIQDNLIYLCKQYRYVFKKEIIEIPLLGKMEVTKGIISLQNDRGTSYDRYIEVQNELAAAINEMRNELATDRFGKKYADINEDQRNAIDKAIPVAISEAEPTKIGESK